MVSVSWPLTSGTVPNVTEVISVTYASALFTRAKYIAPSMDKYGSVAGVVPTDCQFVLPARKERMITPVSCDVLVTFAMPGALHSKLPKRVLVNVLGSTWQNGT